MCQGARSSRYDLRPIQKYILSQMFARHPIFNCTPVFIGQTSHYFLGTYSVHVFPFYLLSNVLPFYEKFTCASSFYEKVLLPSFLDLCTHGSTLRIFRPHILPSLSSCQCCNHCVVPILFSHNSIDSALSSTAL